MSRATMISALAALVMLSSVCAAQPPAIVAQELFDQWDQTYANHDLNKALSFMDPASYVHVDAKGQRQSFAEMRKSMEPLFDTTKFKELSANTEAREVRLEGGRMVVYWKSEFRFQSYGQKVGWMKMIETSTGETTFERKAGQWKVVLEKTFRDNVVVDPQWQAEFNRRLDDLRYRPCRFSTNGC